MPPKTDKASKEFSSSEASKTTAATITSSSQKGPFLPQSLTKFFLYSYPPFFGHPLKPLWVLAEGLSNQFTDHITYSRTYRHFARDHTNFWNVLGHVFPCLGLQLMGNFALLAEIDNLIQVGNFNEYLNIVLKGSGDSNSNSSSTSLLSYNSYDIINNLNINHIFDDLSLRQSTFIIWSLLLVFGPNMLEKTKFNNSNLPSYFLRLFSISLLYLTSRPILTTFLRDHWRTLIYCWPFFELGAMIIPLRKRSQLKDKFIMESQTAQSQNQTETKTNFKYKLNLDNNKSIILPGDSHNGLNPRKSEPSEQEILKAVGPKFAPTKMVFFGKVVVISLVRILIVHLCDRIGKTEFMRKWNNNNNDISNFNLNDNVDNEFTTLLSCLFTPRLLSTFLTLLFLLKTSQQPFHPKLTPFHSSLFLPLFALITNQRWMFFYMTGFFASALQGLVHELSEQKSTLPQLLDLRDEVGHTVWFPLLLVQRVWEKFFGSDSDENIKKKN